MIVPSRGEQLRMNRLPHNAPGEPLACLWYMGALHSRLNAFHWALVFNDREWLENSPPTDGEVKLLMDHHHAAECICAATICFEKYILKRAVPGLRPKLENPGRVSAAGEIPSSESARQIEVPSAGRFIRRD